MDDMNGIKITSNHKPEANHDIRDDLVDAICALDDKQLEKLTLALLPKLLAYDLRAPRVWGDHSRLIISNKVDVIDALFNTRSGTITVEDDCMFGHRCMFLTGNHNYRKKGRDRIKEVPLEGRDIHIKKGAWIGSSCVIIGPCVVGEDAVIAAGSVVTGVKNIPAGTIWAGNPAKQIKEIEFEDQ